MTSFLRIMRKIFQPVLNVSGYVIYSIYWPVGQWLHSTREELLARYGSSVNDLVRRESADIMPLPVSAGDETQRVRLACVGDLEFRDAILQKLQATVDRKKENSDDAIRDAYSTVFSQIVPFLKADITFGNLETVLGRNLGTRVGTRGRRDVTLQEMPSEYDIYYEGVYGNTPFSLHNNHPALAQSLKYNGFTIVSTANEHIRDRLSNGIDETMNMLDNAGLLHVGTFDYNSVKIMRMNVRKAISPYSIIEVNGIRFAFFAYTQRQYPYFPRIGRQNPYGQVCRFAPVHRSWRYHGSINNWIAHARRIAKVDCVIVSAHWGIEHSGYITHKQRRWAKKLCNAGADIIVGHHPHVLQPVENIRTKDGRDAIVLYSLGNLVTDYETADHNTGCIYYLDVVKHKGRLYFPLRRYLPTTTVVDEHAPMPVRIVPLEELGEKARDHMKYACLMLGREYFTIQDGRLVDRLCGDSEQENKSGN
ncbi:MAG: CapA family protein [Spirochaetota bacterium]